jgi:hypothetical protein
MWRLWAQWLNTGSLEGNIKEERRGEQKRKNAFGRKRVGIKYKKQVKDFFPQYMPRGEGIIKNFYD